MHHTWTPSSTNVMPLEDNQVHIWKINLLQPSGIIERLRLTLSQAELSWADRFHKDDHRRRYIAAHGGLRKLLGLYMQMPACDLAFSSSSKGKPFISDQCRAREIRFNLSHSHELALLAVVQSREVGVDVEYLRPMPNAQDLAARFFSKEEKESLEHLPASERTAAFFRCWTRKEALLKASGEGLFAPLDTWNVGFDLLDLAHAVEIRSPGHASEVWELIDLDPADEYAGACAVEGTGCTVRGFELVG